MSDTNNNYSAEELLDSSIKDKLFAGNDAIYKRIIKKFADQGEQNIADIRGYFEGGDIERFTIETHGVKGAAANIGANVLSEEGRKLEFLGKDGKTDEIAENLPAFEQAYRATLQRMYEVVES